MGRDSNEVYTCGVSTPMTSGTCTDHRVCFVSVFRFISTCVYEHGLHFVYRESFWNTATLASFIVPMFFLVHSDSPAFASSFSGSASPSKKCYAGSQQRRLQPNRGPVISNAHQCQKLRWIGDLLLIRSLTVLPCESQFIAPCPSPS